MKAFLRSFILCVALLMVFGIAHSRAAGTFFFEDPMLGKPAPDFTLQTLKGEKTSLTKYRAGQQALVFFWATWCPHCREQLKMLSTTGADIEKKGIKVVLVDIGEDRKTVQRHLEKLGLQKMDAFLDEDSKTAEEYGLIGVPTFYFIDKKGVIQDVEHEIPDNYQELFKPMHDGEPAPAPAK